VRRGLKWWGVGALVLALCAVASPAQAMAKVKCGKTAAVVGVGVVDPIVHHNEPVGSGHEHQFFGSASFLNLPNPNNATQADFETGTTLCDNPADTAGYWSPTLRTVDTGELVGVQQFTAYYRAASGANNGAAQPIPQGARLVAKVYNWTCGTNSGARSAPVDHVPDCRGLSGKPGLTLTSHVTFPSCWDGVAPDHSNDADVVGDTQDSAHFAYPVRKVCPAGFPIGVTQLKETVQYHYVGDPANVVLSSDEHDGVTGGRSLHADYVQSWAAGGLQAEISKCITPAKVTCG
jgi:hypothetical protein